MKQKDKSIIVHIYNNNLSLISKTSNNSRELLGTITKYGQLNLLEHTRAISISAIVSYCHNLRHKNQ